MSERNDNGRTAEWWKAHGEVLELAEWLVNSGQLSTAREVVDYLEKPWHFALEREQMLAERAAA